MKKQVYNPYLPSWEYIPDGEPHVFDGRVYVYGSHDFANGYVYCSGDYVCYSAPIDDLSDWRYEGVIYKKTWDPFNESGRMNLYAPDVTKGPDGSYYLYYVLDKVNVVSVAVCDSPAGEYEFYGYVKYPDGTLLGEREGDEPQFDPAVLTEGDVTYLYTGLCPQGKKSRTGAQATVLESDMLTVKSAPIIIIIVPSCETSKGTGFEGHEFFEASSIRKIGNEYYFIYSSKVLHELCYARAASPLESFRFGGVIISNADIGISSYKPAEMPAAPWGNNHGSILSLGDKNYIFYHRHTHGTNFSRQDCAEEIEISSDGSIKQVMITSCGLNGGPLKGEGEYPAYIACNLFNILGKPDGAKVVQDGGDGDENDGYIAGITDGTTIGFKSFECKGVTKFSVICRGYMHGRFEIKTRWDGEPLGETEVKSANIWEEFTADIAIPDGVNDIYLTYRGTGNPHLGGIRLGKSADGAPSAVTPFQERLLCAILTSLR